MKKSQYPLFENLSSKTPIAFWDGKYINREEFFAHVSSIANTLPEHKYAINLCEDRYVFLVTFVACLLRGQTSLLPPNRAKNEVKYLGRTYPDSYSIVDTLVGDNISNKYYAKIRETIASDWMGVKLENDLIAAIVFTSGSTGNSKPSPKRWSNLVASALKVKKQLQLGLSGYDSIVATVPPQHMFGFEMSIVYPLVNNACIHCDKPFFPSDIKKALDDICAPRILVTTPIHLRGCCESDLEWPDINSIVSATAPLSYKEADQAEKSMNVLVQEIYGCSEVGAIATRYSTKDDYWSLLEDYYLNKKMNRFWLTIPNVDGEIELPDLIEMNGDKQFRLIGRNSDLVNVGGKRGSLADLTTKLKNLAGVKDGIFFIPDSSNKKRVRLAALVVAPDLTEEEIISKLIDYVDRVFLPRPLIKIERLPYTETGKLPRKAILSVLNRYRQARLLLESA